MPTNGERYVTWPKLLAVLGTIVTAMSGIFGTIFAHHTSRPHDKAATKDEVIRSEDRITVRLDRIEELLEAMRD